MTTTQQFCDIAMRLGNVIQAPHFDRTAFKVARIFATLSADGLSANLKLTPDEQEFKCMMAPDLFTAIDNGWGRQGWTRFDIAAASDQDVHAALEMAWRHAQPRKAKAGKTS